MKRTLLYVRRPQCKQGIECSLALEHKHQHHFLSLSLFLTFLLPLRLCFAQVRLCSRQITIKHMYGATNFIYIRLSKHYDNSLAVNK